MANQNPWLKCNGCGFESKELDRLKYHWRKGTGTKCKAAKYKYEHETMLPLFRKGSLEIVYVSEGTIEISSYASPLALLNNKPTRY